MQLLSTFVADLPRTNAPLIPRSATKPAPSPPRKCHSVNTLRFGRENPRPPSRFDKIAYFCSLFIVPNGCSGGAPPPGGARGPRQVPPPSQGLPRQLSNVSCEHGAGERAGGEKGGKVGPGPASTAPAARVAPHAPLSPRIRAAAPPLLDPGPPKTALFAVASAICAKLKRLLRGAPAAEDVASHASADAPLPWKRRLN